jgi:uncharacterized protein YaeQ
MRFENLQVINLSEVETSDLAKLAERSTKLQVNIQDGDVMVSINEKILYVSPIKWKSINL